jgi:hypothetical protein
MPDCCVDCGCYYGCTCPPQIYQQNADGSWTEAEPLGWLEEHNWLQRLIFWVRGIEHCNDREGQRK